jgi:hypothetical protein
MKKPAFLSMIAFAAILPIRTVAQNSDSVAHKISKKLVILSGKVGGEGKNLTADGNSKIWGDSNPETLSGIDLSDA